MNGLKQLYAGIDARVEKFTAKPHWKLTMSAAAVCVMFPAIFVITDINPPTLWQKPFVAGAVKHLILSVGK